MKKKLIYLAIVTALILSTLSACGKKNKEVSDAAEISQSAVEEDAASTNADTEEAVTEETAEDDMPEMSSEDEKQENEDDNLVHNADGTVNYLYYYSSVLTRLHYAITYPSDDLDYEDGEDWLYEISHYGSCSENLDEYGYCLKDISGDGIPELMFTDKDGMTVYNLYTLVDYKPSLVFDGYYRSRYAYMGDNHFGLFASGGAMYQTLGTYKLSENGQELITEDYYFTCEGASRDEMESYHNTIGESDKDKSDLIYNDDFYDIWNHTEAKIKSIGNIVPFSANTLEIAFKEDNPGKKIVANYAADATEYAQTVIIYDNNGMSDVELIGLNYVDITDNGNLVLSMNYIYNMGNTNGDEAIAVTITFGETIPLYGIQYKDSNGVIRKFAIEESGYDGSALVSEF